MLKMMTHLRRAVSAEILKLRRTPSVLLIVVGPLLINLVYGMNVQARHTDFLVDDAWQLLARNMFGNWTVVILPLLCCAVTALWANFEHQSDQWKHLFALPIPRWAIYGAKWLLSLALMAISSVVFWAGVLLQGWVLRYLVPGFGFEAAAPAGAILQSVFGIYLAAVLIITLHAWISLRWKNLILALGLGVGAFMTNVFAYHSETVGRVFPWTLPMRIRNIPGADPLEAIAISLAGALIVAALGGLHLARRDVL